VTDLARDATAKGDETAGVGRVPSRAAAWLRVYLGYAPGVGKTYAMLHEGRELRRRGSDVVIGWVETYARLHTAAAVGDLEVVPPRVVTYRGTPVKEMDLEAVIMRRPQVALIDELAHTNVPGSKNLKRYQDVLDLEASGIDVISTLNIQHLASLQHTIQLLAGVTVTETLPDWVLDGADEVEMIDQSPEALQQRLRHGNIQPRNQVKRALDGFFRLETLSALRELTLRRMAEHAERKLQTYQLGSLPAPSSETVLVCVPPNELAQLLVRRGVHLAQRLRARLVVLHIAQPGQSRGHHEAMKALELARALGAEVQSHAAPNVADAMITCAVATGATHLVLGEPTGSRLMELLRGSVVRDVVRGTRNVDVHIVHRPSP
jgi:two-component system, OmpR family, sensor histidine kinase KdpD